MFGYCGNPYDYLERMTRSKVDRTNMIFFMLFTWRCKQASFLTEQDIICDLQTNFYIATETRETTTQPYLCDLCEEGDAKEATHACDKCRQRMCKACRRLHDKFFDPREHPVRALNIHEAAPKKSETRKWCTLHRDQELCFHCKDCDVSICLHCKLTLHQPHVTEDMAAAILRGKEELMKLVATAKEQVRRHIYI